MDEEGLIDRWNARGAEFKELLTTYNAANLDYRMDLEAGRLWWHDLNGSPIVDCKTRLLLSYTNQDRSVLMSWANPDIPKAAHIARVDGAPDQIANCDHYSAWIWALRLADAAEAEYFYRAPTRAYWLFLGLWDVRKVSGA